MAKKKLIRISRLPGKDADRAGVERFVAVMLAKLKKKRGQGYGGWNEREGPSIPDLQRMMAEHVAKGDPVDVANFAMMIWNRQNPHGAFDV